MTAISVSERLLEMAAFYTPLALTVTKYRDVLPLCGKTSLYFHFAAWGKAI